MAFSLWIALPRAASGVLRAELAEEEIRALEPPDQLAADIDGLLAVTGPLDRLALCCARLDASTPDENVRAIFEAARG